MASAGSCCGWAQGAGLIDGSGGGAKPPGGGGGGNAGAAGGANAGAAGGAKAGAGVDPEKAEPAAGRSNVLPPDGPRMAFRSLPAISERAPGAWVKRSTAAFTSRARPPYFPPYL